MHPKKIIEDVLSYGSEIVMENGEIFLKNPDNIPWEIQEYISSQKKRLIAYLKGEYQDKQAAIDQTIEKLFIYWRDIPQPGTEIIQHWLDREPETFDLLSELSIELAKKGWNDPNESFVPYETERSVVLAAQIYAKAIDFMNRGENN